MSSQIAHRQRPTDLHADSDVHSHDPSQRGSHRFLKAFLGEDLRSMSVLRLNGLILHLKLQLAAVTSTGTYRHHLKPDCQPVIEVFPKHC